MTTAEKLLGVTLEAKPRVYNRLYEAAEVASVSYLLELLMAAGIATLGLVLNSPAVVIGAMLISPLMGPILAAGLALAASDVFLGVKCLINLTASVLISILFSAALVWFLPFHSPTAEILARTRPNLLDLGVALFSGLAGSLLTCRGGGGGGVTALPGVAIAVALMPPLCTVGFGVGSGWDWTIISGAGLLFFTNLAAIVACAFLVFLLVRIGSPDMRDMVLSTHRERMLHDRLYAFFERTRLSKTIGHFGELRWRILMLLVTLAILFFPLSKSLIQVRDETITRGAFRDALRTLGPSDTFLTQQLDILPDRVLARLVVTMPIEPAKLQDAEKLLSARSGKPASIIVRQVASQDEIALLRAALSAPAPPAPAPPPAPPDLDALRRDAVARLEQPLKEAWPEEQATLDGYEIGFTTQGTVARIRYTANKDLDAAAQDVLSRVLKARLKSENLQLILERQVPPPVTPQTR